MQLLTTSHGSGASQALPSKPSLPSGVLGWSDGGRGVGRVGDAVSAKSKSAFGGERERESKEQKLKRSFEFNCNSRFHRRSTAKPRLAELIVIVCGTLRLLLQF